MSAAGGSSSPGSAAGSASETNYIQAQMAELTESIKEQDALVKKSRANIEAKRAIAEKKEPEAAQIAYYDRYVKPLEQEMHDCNEQLKLLRQKEALLQRKQERAEEALLLGQPQPQSSQQQQAAADLQSMIDIRVRRAMQAFSAVTSPVEMKTEESDEESLQSESVAMLAQNDVMRYANKMKAALTTKVLKGKKHKFCLVHKNNGSWAVKISAPVPENSNAVEGELLCCFDILSIKYLKDVYITWTWQCLYDLRTLQNRINEKSIPDFSEVTTP